MGNYPKDVRYTKDHEWARQKGKAVVVGVTDHAQESLGDVAYVELPKVGDTLTAGKSFGVIESTKAVSELFAPLTGKVVNVNESLQSAPQTVNSDPYGEGWLVEIEPADSKAFEGLLDAAAYEKLVADAK